MKRHFLYTFKIYNIIQNLKAVNKTCHISHEGGAEECLKSVTTYLNGKKGSRTTVIVF